MPKPSDHASESADVNFRAASFMLSAVDLKQLPNDVGHEVAFIGASNAGKSSTINTLTGIKGLARTSKTPGRTQQINFFSLGDEATQRLVDLPGYGYAKVPLATKENWEKIVNAYLQERQSLSGLVVIMDIRHPLKTLDEQLIAWARTCELPVHAVLTKADKLSKGARMNQCLKVRKALADHPLPYSVQIFSSLEPLGVEELTAQLEGWLA